MVFPSVLAVFKDVEKLQNGITQEYRTGDDHIVPGDASLTTHGFPCVDFSEQLRWEDLVRNGENVKKGLGESGVALEGGLKHMQMSLCPFLFEENVPRLGPTG